MISERLAYMPSKVVFTRCVIIPTWLSYMAYRQAPKNTQASYQTKR